MVDCATKWFAIAAAVSLLASIVCKIIARIKQYDHIWFHCRALAESAKTITWRYIVGVPPYDITVSLADADRTLIAELDEIRKARPSVTEELAKFPCESDRITSAMRQSRHLGFADRRRLYLDKRLRDQAHWYKLKARTNYNAGEKVFWWTISIQILALITGVTAIIIPKTPNALAFLVSATAGIVAWGEMKRYRDLTQSYTVAADDLVSAVAVWDHITDEAELQRRVIQTEEAISREHTMWCAKRIT